jgi:1-deoxy-D-xylulose-5-phosphate reductoisomerase
MRSISIFGATGSIGASTLDLVRRNRDQWQVEALTAHCSAVELAALAIEFGAKLAVVSDEACLPELRAALAGSGIAAAGGRAALCEAAARPVDMTVAAIVGCAGLAPVMASRCVIFLPFACTHYAQNVTRARAIIAALPTCAPATHHPIRAPR